MFCCCERLFFVCRVLLLAPSSFRDRPTSPDWRSPVGLRRDGLAREQPPEAQWHAVPARGGIRRGVQAFGAVERVLARLGLGSLHLTIIYGNKHPLKMAKAGWHPGFLPVPQPVELLGTAIERGLKLRQDRSTGQAAPPMNSMEST